jgi:uncharacterized protein (DUF58 family)
LDRVSNLTTRRPLLYFGTQKDKIQFVRALRSSIAIDWGSLAPLRLRARSISEGIWAGAHRSVRRGAGVEFGGNRPYVAGDDLRWIDRRALLRHDRLMVREFETETDRGLRLVIDATASMAQRSGRAPGAKFAYAALVAAALARVSLASGDPVGLSFLGGDTMGPLSAASGPEAFERVVGALESARAAGDLSDNPASVQSVCDAIARRSRRGTIIVLLSDLIDLPQRAIDHYAALASAGRVLVVVQVLDPEEATFPFSGIVRLRALEGDFVVETDADATRAHYLSLLDEIAVSWSERLTDLGGHFLRTETTRDAATVVRNIVARIAGAARPTEGVR